MIEHFSFTRRGSENGHAVDISEKTARDTVLPNGGDHRPILDADHHGQVIPKINQCFFSILPAQSVDDLDQIPHILHREIFPAAMKAFLRVA